MKRTMLKQYLAAAWLAAASLSAHAHEGHGLPGSAHWHAQDSLLWLGTAVVAAAAWWLIRRK